MIDHKQTLKIDTELTVKISDMILAMPSSKEAVVGAMSALSKILVEIAISALGFEAGIESVSFTINKAVELSKERNHDKD